MATLRVPVPLLPTNGSCGTTAANGGTVRLKDWSTTVAATDCPPVGYTDAGPVAWSPPPPRRPRIAPAVRRRPPVGRNERCPCGSGKKFKRCCLR